MKWSPSQPNGWFPKLSPDGERVLYGFGEVFKAEIGLNRFKEEYIGKGFTYGWLNNLQLMWSKGEDEASAELHRFTVGLGDELIPSQNAAGNWLDANNEHWVSSLASANSRIVLDDEIIDFNGMKVKTSNGRVLYHYIPNDCLKLYENESFVEIYPTGDFNEFTLSREGYIGHGYNGPAWIIRPNGRTSEEVTVTPWNQESVPVVIVIDGITWIWTGTVDPYDKKEKVLGRPLGSQTCIVLEDQPYIGLSVAYYNEEWIIAGCTNRGALVVQRIPYGSIRVPIVDRRPPMPQPQIDFSLNRQIVNLGQKVLGTLTQEENCWTWRWRKNGIKDLPESGDTHEFKFDAPGEYQIEIAVQGFPVDEDHQEYLPGTRVYITPSKSVKVLPVEKPSFYYGMQTGFGAPIGIDRYIDLAARKWTMARVEATNDYYVNEQILMEAVNLNIEPLILCLPENQPCLPKVPLFIEPFNEPNAGCGKWPKLTPDEYARRVDPMFGGPHEIVIGCINNPDKEAIAWLKQVVKLLPHAKYVSYHRYPQNDWDVATIPRKDYKTLDQEFGAVWDACGDRIVICSEFGWHNSPFRQPYFSWWPHGPGKIRTLSEKETHDRIRDWFNILKKYKIRAGIVFQIWEDGPKGRDKDFGIYRLDWTAKPASNVPLEG